MARYILLDSDNKVVNLTEGDESWTPPTGYSKVATDSGAIGDTYDPSDGSFTTPDVTPIKTHRDYYLEASDDAGRLQALAVAVGVLFRDEEGTIT